MREGELGGQMGPATHVDFVSGPVAATSSRTGRSRRTLSQQASYFLPSRVHVCVIPHTAGPDPLQPQQKGWKPQVERRASLAP